MGPQQPVLGAAAIKVGTALWYLSRGTGVVALLLLTAGVLLGILESRRWVPRRWPKFSIAMLHRDISLVSLALIGVHVATIVLDGFAPIGWRDAVLPFLSPYRPLWVGLGTLALDIQIALLATSLLRRHLSFPIWRAVHWLAYACWPVALVHGLGSGTDTRVSWLLALDVLCVATVVGALLWRLSMGRESPLPRILGGVTAVAAPVLVAVWVVGGPLQPGWARRAGTPTSLLAAARTERRTPSVSPSPAPSPAATLPSPPFQAQLAGTIRQKGRRPGEASVVEIDATLSQGAAGRLRIVLEGPAISGEGLEVTSSQVALGGPTGAATYQGVVTGLDGARIVASLHSPTGQRILLEVDLNLDPSSTRVTGTVTARAGG